MILRLKCHKFDIGWGSVPYPAGELYNAPLTPYSGEGDWLPLPVSPYWNNRAYSREAAKYVLVVTLYLKCT